jgi:hypothetical protein
MVQKNLQAPLTKRPERWKPLGFFLILLRLLKDFKMPNRSKGSDLWSEILQVSVTPKVKNQIVQIAHETSTSQSTVVRGLLDQALDSD